MADVRRGAGEDGEPGPRDEIVDSPATTPGRGVSRRRLIGGAGVGAAGAAVGAVAGFGGGRASADPAPAAGVGGPTDVDTVDLTRSHDFYVSSTGGHQAGIETPQQRYCVYMTFDLVTPLTRDVQVLLARWSAAIAQLVAGRAIGAVEPQRAGAVAPDTGEALDLEPASLTVTLGLGPGVFDDRYGLADRAPARLAALPALPSDQLDPALTGGDLSLQACADDPQVAYHAIRNLARMGRGIVNTRWTVIGFGRASAGKGQQTPRNLMGFKDGTRNIREADEYDDHVWVADDDVAWMAGGTYQVARKIRMDIEIWDADDVADQGVVIGRTKQHGVAHGATSEFDTPDFSATDASGALVIDPTAHIALAAHENNGGTKILRRGYNFTDGISPVGQLDAGLLFLAYMHDPASFVTLQTRLGGSDMLNEYIAHVGSGVFAVPPAPRAGRYIGQELFS